MRAEFTKVECITQYPEIIRVNCTIGTQKYNNRSALYVEVILEEEVKSVNGIYIISFKHDNRFINYTAVELDYCESLHMLQNHPLLQLIVNNIRSVSNTPIQCPFKKNFKYYLNGFTIERKMIPTYLPEVIFKTDATFLWNQRQVLRITVFGIVGHK
ncbi:hypothetical protein KR222_004931 [Zaprionus bogoriensis]|nr:hypothetical protein KR222_004931 [Zaprionus bogoriensis]